MHVPEEPEQQPQPKKPEENPWRQYGRYSQMALALPAGVIAGLIVGALLDRWLHHGAEQVTQRMLAAPGKPARFRFSLAFFGRYLFVIVVGYAIFKSSVQALYGFLAALLVPVGAMMAEAAYQALAGGKTSSDA